MLSETAGAPQKIVVLGCGRVGSTLAKQMSGEGHDVTVVDLTSDSFRRLGTKFRGQRIVGSGLDQDLLKRAGLDQAGIFIAVTQGDNTNIMAAQIAREVFDVAPRGRTDLRSHPGAGVPGVGDHHALYDYPGGGADTRCGARQRRRRPVAEGCALALTNFILSCAAKGFIYVRDCRRGG